MSAIESLMAILPHYAGVGSRETPDDICRLMTVLGKALAGHYVLRSGGAIGADKAFERGCDAAQGLKLIWTGDSKVSEAAYALAKEVHPAGKDPDPERNFDSFSLFVKTLHARNGYQVLGEDLSSPVDFVVCWTQDGCESKAARRRTTGGTGQAIAVASLNGVPVYNLKNKSSRFGLHRYLLSKGISVSELVAGLAADPTQFSLFD